MERMLVGLPIPYTAKLLSGKTFVVFMDFTSSANVIPLILTIFVLYGVCRNVSTYMYV